MTAEDHHARPQLRNPLATTLAAECAPPPPETQRGKDNIVLADLPAILRRSAAFWAELAGLCRLAILRRIHAVQRDAPFEAERQQYRPQRLRQMCPAATPGRG